MKLQTKQYFKMIAMLSMLLLVANPLFAEADGANSKKLLLKVSGDITETVSWKKPLVTCEKDGGILAQNVLNIMALENKKIFKLKIPLSVATLGEHEVVGPKDSKSYKLGNISVAYNPDMWQSGKASGGYQKYVSGTVTFTNIPKKEGEHLTGTLKAKASLKRFKGRAVEMDVVFDIVAGNQTFNKCSFSK